MKKPIHALHLPTACSATSPNFHLPPCYKSPPLEVNISLDMANLNMINISSLNFCIWQHLDQHWNESHLQHLASIPSVPVGQLYNHRHSLFYTFFIGRIIRGYKFNLDTVFIYRSLCNSYRITDTNRFGNILLSFLLVSTCKTSASTFTTRYHTIYNLDADVEAAPIYRCNGETSQPIRPCENHGLHIEYIPTWTES